MTLWLYFVFAFFLFYFPWVRLRQDPASPITFFSIDTLFFLANPLYTSFIEVLQYKRLHSTYWILMVLDENRYTHFIYLNYIFLNNQVSIYFTSSIFYFNLSNWNLFIFRCTALYAQAILFLKIQMKFTLYKNNLFDCWILFYFKYINIIKTYLKTTYIFFLQILHLLDVD